jgi:hypothetical protein
MKDIDKKTVRREEIEPIKRVFTYVIFSLTNFIRKQHGTELHKLFSK